MQPYLVQFVQRLMEDSEPEVMRETIASLGQLGQLEHVPWLMSKLADRRLRLATLDALAAYGLEVLEALRQCLLDPKQDVAVRRNIPRVLARIGEQESVDLLMEVLGDIQPPLQYPVIKALSKLRNRFPDLDYHTTWVQQVLRDEIRASYEFREAIGVFPEQAKDVGAALLKKALREKQEQGVERIFRLLGLCYEPQDMYHAYLGYVSGDSSTRASAIEFLDNVLDSPLDHQLVPLLDPTAAISSRRDADIFGTRMHSREQVLAHLMGGNDAWLRACAVLNLSSSSDEEERSDLLERAREDANAVVRETASLVMGSTR